MRRVIVDYKKLNQEILDLLVEKYPDGYESSDIIKFRNAQNEVVEAVEVRTEDTIYLVKVSKRLADTMENYEEEDEDDLDPKDPDEDGTLEVAEEESDDDY